uniref:Uncharacterized protein n=1 Tax=Arundo donax TaxID=35708 RepID=A0A0A8Z4T9_ARUDO
MFKAHDILKPSILFFPSFIQNGGITTMWTLDNIVEIWHDQYHSKQCI